MSNAPIDLKARAHKAMLDAGFHPDFPPNITAEIQALKPSVAAGSGSVQDLRALLWSSIDNDSSRDLDQVEYVEKLPDGSVKLLVGIADVDSSVPKRLRHGPSMPPPRQLPFTPAWLTPSPMLPDTLSTDLDFVARCAGSAFNRD